MKAIVTYVVIVYALSIALSLLVGLTGGQASPVFGLAYLSMFLPATTVTIVHRVMNEGPRIA
jgi:hypothetical protein